MLVENSGAIPIRNTETLDDQRKSITTETVFQLKRNFLTLRILLESIVYGVILMSDQDLNKSRCIRFFR
jgi:hypothetical protein